jgi:hypothetical protein
MIAGLLKGILVGKYDTADQLPKGTKGITGPDDLKKKSVKELSILFNSLVAEPFQIGKFASVLEGATKTWEAIENFQITNMEKPTKPEKAPKAPKAPKEKRATKTDAIRAYIVDKDEFTVEEIMALVADDRRGNVTTTLTILCNPVRTKKDPIPYKYDKTVKKFVKTVPAVPAETPQA